MKPQVIRSTMLTLQVCAPAAMDNADLENYVNRVHGGGWTVAKNATRVACDENKECVHVWLGRGR